MEVFFPGFFASEPFDTGRPNAGKRKDVMRQIASLSVKKLHGPNEDWSEWMQY